MIVGGQPEVQSNPGLAPDVALRIFPLRIKFQHSQTSSMRTPKGQNQVSALQRCPYYRGRYNVCFLALLGPNKLSAIERCLHYRGVHTERFRLYLDITGNSQNQQKEIFWLPGRPATLDTLQNVLKLLPLNLCFHR